MKGAGLDAASRGTKGRQNLRRLFGVAVHERLTSATPEAALTAALSRGTVALTSPLENWVPRPAAQRIPAARPPVLSNNLGACFAMNRTQRFFCGSAFAFSVLCAVASAPRPSSAGDDWLPVPPADLALKDNPASPGAHAMILYRASDMDSKESSVREYVRIKIFTQEGTKEADIELPFNKQQVNIMDIRGRTIHPDGSIVNFEGKAFEKTIVKASGFKYLAKTFTLPDVHPGSIIEYKFREQSDANFYVNESWTITGSLYTRDAHFVIRPDTRSDAAPMYYRQYDLPPGALPVKQPNGTFVMDIHNVPGLEEEEYMPPERMLRHHVDFYYVNPLGPRNGDAEKFWNRKGKAWSDEVDRFVSKKGALESELGHTVSADDPPEVKLRKIYARVAKNPRSFAGRCQIGKGTKTGTNQAEQQRRRRLQTQLRKRPRVELHIRGPGAHGGVFLQRSFRRPAPCGFLPSGNDGHFADYLRHCVGARRHAGLLSGSRRQRFPLRDSALVRNQHAGYSLQQDRRRNRHRASRAAHGSHRNPHRGTGN